MLSETHYLVPPHGGAQAIKIVFALAGYIDSV